MVEHKCGETRPKDKEGEEKTTEKKFKLDDIGDLPITLTIYGGCTEGDRMTYSVRSDQRAVVAYGTVKQLIQYSIGEEVTLTHKEVPKTYRGKPFKRNPSRKFQDAILSIKAEMSGEGDAIADLIRKAGEGSKHGGYTVQINGQKVTEDSSANSYFKEITFVMDGDKPVPKPSADVTAKDKVFMKDGQPVKMMGGVELVVTAVIIPGNGYQSVTSQARYASLDKMV